MLIPNSSKGFTFKIPVFRVEPRGFEPPTLRRAKADHSTLACTTVSGKPACLCCFGGFWAVRMSAAYRIVPARLQYGCSKRPSNWVPRVGPAEILFTTLAKPSIGASSLPVTCYVDALR